MRQETTTAVLLQPVRGCAAMEHQTTTTYKPRHGVEPQQQQETPGNDESRGGGSRWEIVLNEHKTVRFVGAAPNGDSPGGFVRWMLDWVASERACGGARLEIAEGGVGPLFVLR